MTTNLKHDNLDEPNFNSLFEFSSNKEEIQHEARLIMYRFLSEIERTSNQQRGLKTKLAKAINRSSSYITQLFNGDKLINLPTLAKFQKALGIKFKIIVYPEGEFYSYSNSTNNEMIKNIFISKEVTDIASVTEGAEKSGSVQTIKKSNPLYS